MKKALALAAIFLMAAVKPGHAQFGGVVYDPTNFHNALLRYYQLRLQVVQLQQTYQQILNQYNLAVQMAKHIKNMPARYKAQFSQWRPLTTVPDAYQNTGAWVNGVNSGALPSVLAGYRGATNQLERYSANALAAMSREELQRATSTYASVELADGANVNGMTTIGNIRANAQAIQNQIRNLENDSLSSDPALNSEVGVLNKINAANVLILRTLQDSNNLKLATLEQQVLSSKETRDATVNAINMDIYQRDHMVNQMTQFTNGLGASLKNYRLP